MSLSLATTEL